MTKTLQQLLDEGVDGRHILVRSDFNVPLDDDGNITDAGRIDASIPTLKALLDGGAKVIVMAHLGRPKGEVNPKYSLAPVADAVAIGRRTVRVALTAIWIGIGLSVGLMLVATPGIIPAVAGALTQELVDLTTILYALRALRGPTSTLLRGQDQSTGEQSRSPRTSVTPR